MRAGGILRILQSDWFRDRAVFCAGYNGGQKCWDVSSDITKTSDSSPPTPNKVEFGAKWVRMSAFLATTLLGGVGERRDEPKAEQKNCP